ncbi:MAG: leucine-rich repeat domain-containing protein [Cytophagales bacterium]|nr:leucine-rich repeat domain-containing protein [Cytophagales bacterium]
MTEQEQKICLLLSTKDNVNIDLAYELSKGLEVNCDKLIEDFFVLSFWRELFPKEINESHSIKEQFSSFNNVINKYCISKKLIDQTENYLSSIILFNSNGTSITKLPELFGNLKQLVNLVLYNTNITELPKSFGELKNLTHLQLNKTNITKLPESFGKLKNLKDLDLSNTKLNSFPPSFQNLNKLVKLSLVNTEITKIPDFFSHLTNLRILNISEELGKQKREIQKNILPKCSIYISK